ncbi:MAG: type II toxin-antitoxin system HicB family antitoxin [Asticcacaulis sp.]
MTYIGLLEKEPQSLWGISFPDIPGCVSAGETADLAMTNAIDAVRSWLEAAKDDGEDAPSPRTIEEIMIDPEVVSALAKGGAIVRIPVVRGGGRLVRINLSLDSNVLEMIDDAAKVRGLTRSAFLAGAAQTVVLGAGA